MTRDETFLHSLVHELVSMPGEQGWLEFKHNNSDPQEIGEYLAALANAAALDGKAHAYLLWGVDDATHALLGTSFDPQAKRVGAEELESWLLRQLSPRIGFHFHKVTLDGKALVLLEIDRAFRHPVQFQGAPFIRVGSYKKKLKDFPEKERQLWRVLDDTPFEMLPAAERVGADELLRLLDSPPRSRNESLASLMRRIGVCEERGSGVDKVVFQTELFQLPAPAFEVVGDSTRSTLFTPRPLARMDMADRVRAVYLHACLRYVERDFMTNTTLRGRFGLDARNSAMASRLIKDALVARAIRLYDESAPPRYRKYVPHWA